MDMDNAVKVLEEMKQKLMLLRDVSGQFGDAVLARDYARQVRALETALEELENWRLT